MARSSAIADLLRAGLEKVETPKNYGSLRDKLMDIKPTSQPPIIRESPENKRRNTRIAGMLAAGTSYSDVQEAMGCSRATVAKIAKRVRPAA